MAARILLIDNETDFRTQAAERLRQAGYDVEERMNAWTALQSACDPETRPDLIVMDVNLPVILGSEFMEMLMTRGQQIPILIVTHSASLPQLRDAVRLFRAQGFPIRDVQFKSAALDHLPQWVMSALGNALIGVGA